MAIRTNRTCHQAIEAQKILLRPTASLSPWGDSGAFEEEQALVLNDDSDVVLSLRRLSSRKHAEVYCEKSRNRRPGSVPPDSRTPLTQTPSTPMAGVVSRGWPPGRSK